MELAGILPNHGTPIPITDMQWCPRRACKFVQNAIDEILSIDDISTIVSGIRGINQFSYLGGPAHIWHPKRCGPAHHCERPLKCSAGQIDKCLGRSMNWRTGAEPWAWENGSWPRISRASSITNLPNKWLSTHSNSFKNRYFGGNSFSLVA